MTTGKYGPHVPEKTYIPHAYPEHLFDTGEITLNYAVSGSPELPALLLIPGQTESWWSYEAAMELLKDRFNVYAVDLRGQGRSTRTPGRYILDTIGNDLVRFIAFRIRRPVIVSGHSSGGVIAAWLSAYAPPGMLRGAYYEDPCCFHSELTPECGPSIRQGMAGRMLALMNKHLGDQWTLGDEEGFARAAADLTPAAPAQASEHSTAQILMPVDSEALARRRQFLKEYDPEWARAFVAGTVAASCDHARMLAAVKCPVLFTHHFRMMDEKSGVLTGASSDLQAARVAEIITAAGQPLTYKSFPTTVHAMHTQDPELFATTLVEWAKTLPEEALVRSAGVFAQ